MEKEKLFFSPMPKKSSTDTTNETNRLDDRHEYQSFIRRYLMLTPDARQSVRDCANNLYEQLILKKLSNLPDDVKEKIYCMIEEAAQ